jgi:hypothetical protein
MGGVGEPGVPSVAEESANHAAPGERFLVSG